VSWLAATMGCRGKTLEQKSSDMALHGFCAQWRALEDLGPHSNSGHVQHDQTKRGKNHKQRIEIGVDRAGSLGAGDSLTHDSHLVKGQATQHATTQQTAFVEYFAHPGGGYPGRLLDLFQQALHDPAQNVSGGIARVDGVPNVVDEGNETLVNHGVDQLLTVVEVVMHHGGGEPGMAGDGGEAGGCDTVLGEQFGGCGEEQDAGIAVGVGYGAAGTFGGALVKARSHN